MNKRDTFNCVALPDDYYFLAAGTVSARVDSRQIRGRRLLGTVGFDLIVIPA